MAKHKKINSIILELCNKLIESIGQDLLSQTDREEVQKILFHERNRDRAVLRLCQIESNYKDVTVFSR